jgi:hypothetical protein
LNYWRIGRSDWFVDSFACFEIAQIVLAVVLEIWRLRYICIWYIKRNRYMLCKYLVIYKISNINHMSSFKRITVEIRILFHTNCI